MIRSSQYGLKVVLVMALMSLCAALYAGTTVLDLSLGDSFTGTIATAGVDTVEARFLAAEGASVRLTLQAARGATLQPTVVIRDPSGSPLATGATQQISWLPVANLVHRFTAPVAGMYVVQVGGSTGSGDFWARLDGSAGDVLNPELSGLSGVVTSSLDAAVIPDASVVVGSSLFATTDAAGSYSGNLPAGSYSVTFSAEGFESATQAVTLTTGMSETLSISLDPLVPVQVSAGASGDQVAGGTLTGSLEVVMPPGSVVESIVWTQEHGVPVTIVGGDTATPTITLGTESAYKDHLVETLTEPPVTQEQLPPNVTIPEGEFPGGLQSRIGVVGVDPFALEQAAVVVLHVDVTTEFGSFGEEVEIHTTLPWKVSPGLRNVPQGAPVLLNSREQAMYDWNLFPPPGSSAVLSDKTTKHAYFTPDLPGLYKLELGDGGPREPLELEIHAGIYRGIIVGQDIEGRPVADTACTLCHDGGFAPDKFTDWRQTGHAEILTNNLNTSTHYGPNCFPCHTVGYDPATDNGGVDESADYSAFLDSGLINTPGDNWTTVLSEYPETARKSNIQCDNCHGPQQSTAHGLGFPLGAPRVDLSSSVCATCHGEPLRHARFQQWQLSGHANYGLAIRESGSGSCSRCHTANGFLTWLPILLDDDPETDPTASISVDWTEDESHPQTCVTCHDPHNAGTTTGINTNATVRISGDTPPLIAGFTATDVGRGAICMTCHNSRRGKRDETTWDQHVGTNEATRAPHGSAQTDVLMGQNAYFVNAGTRGSHSMVEDACVACHMEATPPPAVLSYNQGGTNHTFEASLSICSDCHSPHLLAEDVQTGVDFLLDQVEDLVEDGAHDLMATLIAQGNTIDLNGQATIADAGDIVSLQFGESRGRQSFTVTLTGGTFGPMSAASIDVVDGSDAVIGALYDFADPALPRAGWNYGLFHNDGSHGIHNPIFATSALSAARDALVAATPTRNPASEAAPNKRLQQRRQLLDRMSTRWRIQSDRRE